MDPAQEISFAAEAECTLRTLRSVILVHRQAERGFETREFAVEIGRLSVKAEEAGLRAAAFVLSKLENDLSRANLLAGPANDAVSLALLDSVAHAEAELVKLTMAGGDQFFNSAEVDDLSLDSFFQDERSSSDALTPIETPDDDVYVPDAEMLEVFAEEAEELLNNIDLCIETLNACPEDKEAVWELRRHAHTFKGAAGIIGLKEPSRLAHRVEDILDDLGNRGIVPDPRVIGLITVAAGHLRLLTDPNPGDMPPGRTDQLNQAFDEVLQQLTKQPEAHDIKDNVPAELPEQPLEHPAETAAPPAEAKRPIVRVAINRLDDLVLTVRDLVVSRSVIEQRLAEYEELLESLTSVTRKLQAATAKIEIDHEAAMLETLAPARFDQAFGTELADDVSDRENERFDSLELDRYTDFHESSRQLSDAARELFSISTSLESLRSGFDSVLGEQHRLIDDAQTKVAQIRLIRFDSISTRLQRAVRVACEEEGKKAEITVENPEIELDTNVLDSLVEPLMHLIRNAVAHGVESPETRRLVGKPETGVVSVGLSDQETYIELTVRDDGRGIDAAALRHRAVGSGLIGVGHDVAANSDGSGLLDLMCLPGLTTAEKLSMSAGRGVGMSIVKESVESRRGSIAVETSLHRGTTFTVRLPIAFTVARALVVRAGEHFAGIPARAISQIIDAASANTSRMEDGREVLTIGSMRFPLHDLREYFTESQAAPADGSSVVLLLECRGERLAMRVDEVLKISKLAVKTAGRPVDQIGGLLGVATSGSGSVVPVLDLQYFAKATPIRPAARPATAPVTKPTALVVDDSASVRQMTSRMVLAAGWNVLTAKDGVEALEVLRSNTEIKIVFTDVEMPRMDGYELTASIRADNTLCSMPVVFITSRGGEKHRGKAVELGVTEYLTKPFFETDLLAVVGRIASNQQTPVI